MEAEGLVPLSRNELKLSFEGKRLNYKGFLYRRVNRYFIPVDEVFNLDERFHTEIKEIRSILYNKESNGGSGKSKGYIINGKIYVSLFDLCKIFSLRTRWNHKERSITLYYDSVTSMETVKQTKGRSAYIRLEDITAGDEYIEDIKLEKFRVAADYLASVKIPFHIAWIPRFIDPANKIDNDISIDYNIANAHFLFTLEYLLEKGGIIGLHGYTHQYGEEVSGEGTEFSDTRNDDEISIRRRIEAAINTAKKLELPVSFFESPHYASTAYQQSIYESYFNIIYEGCVGIWGEKIVISPRNHKTLYIPTPLGYVQGENGTEDMINRIKLLEKKVLPSLFYHPYKEFDYITFLDSDERFLKYSYSDTSPLHLICNELIQQGCIFSRIDELKSSNFRKCFFQKLLDLR